MTLRRAVGSMAAALVPGLDEFVFNRDRTKAFPNSFRPVSNWHSTGFRERAPHVAVVALEGPGDHRWGPAQGNYFFEVYQTAVERFGPDSVSVVDLDGAAPDDWSERVQWHLQETQATHMIAQLEKDPGIAHDWTWDVAWSQIANSWDGVFVGVTFDSGFPLIRMKARRLSRISPAFVCLDICVPMDHRLIRGRVEVGPVPLVESQLTQGLLFERIDGEPKDVDVSFIGALYPYRVELVENLQAVGIDVAVNPHRNDEATDFASSRTNQPTWLDYMAGLARSQMTLNFSLASSGRDEQLKWRVMEATLAGTLLLTDDRTRTAEFFVPGQEFDQFTGPEDLSRVVTSWLERPRELNEAQRKAQSRAREIARNEFWDRIVRTLSARGLPPLPRPAR